MRIAVEEVRRLPMAEQEVEIVERKGIGHPDTLCDGAMEAVAVALAEAYHRQCGTLLHFNVDKCLLSAGRTEIGFGGGRVVQPMELVIGDRASDRLGETVVPVAEIAEEAARRWFGSALRHLDARTQLRCRTVLSPGSVELTGLFAGKGTVLRGANDTSATVGYWPLSPLETVVLQFEQWLNSPSFKSQFPETGEDVKVMGVRLGKTLDLTVAMPLLASGISSEVAYFDRKAEIQREMLGWVEANAPFDTLVHFNALDAPGRGLAGVYLSLLGTSAEDGDSGQVGRGNRVNGLIPVGRPLGTEAAAGKNPVSHAGKIYSVLAHELAREIGEGIEGMRELYVYLASRIGAPIESPALVAVQLLPEPGVEISGVAPAIEDIVHRSLSGMAAFCERLIRGECRIF